jgi:hypothetical protein
MALGFTRHTPGPPLFFDGNQAAGSTAVSGARVNPGLQFVVVDIGFDASYDAAGGGEPVTAANVELSAISHMVIEPAEGYVFQYVASTGRIKAFYGDWNNASDGPLVEVPDTTNLSLIITRALVLGY